MNEMYIVTQFARLWGIETAHSNLDSQKHQTLISYDSQDLMDLLINWKNEYVSNEKYDDTVEFFENKLKEFIELTSNKNEPHLLITTDGSSICVNEYASYEIAYSEMEKDFNSYSPDNLLEEWANYTYIDNYNAELYNNGYNVYLWHIYKK